ncbi:hypothetical protein B0A81_21445 [Flavobacterium plurextorum]|uniref:Uncharacterized protein n=2 Tax=Flavobacterium plurextorum TaxID=1114867 RepID=A0ABX4CNI7_9FLAO|nr:hypothetical protein B0A81_21445 [Flavobacterium plurextorum]
MVSEILRNVVYSYYPKDVCFNTEITKYLGSDEYQKLYQRIKKFDHEHRQDISKGIIREFKKNNYLKNFEDFTLLDLGERCMTFSLTVIRDGNLYTISLFLTVIVPYYSIKLKKHKAELLFSEPKKLALQEIGPESKKITDIILIVENFVENRLGQKKIPEDLLNHIIQDVSYQDLEIGSFTMFNAFFNNLKLDEHDN